MTAPDQVGRHQAQGRDRAIGRLRRLTRWVVAAATAGTGIGIGLAAYDTPGHATPVTSGGSSARSAESPPAASSTGGGEFSPPPVSPSASAGRAHAVTGQT